ncbi:alpha/beta hydrolase [Brunnivagina elsteri]|uniref:Alpha/beta hydrolase n=1 Tax=Brunnivagina elsteri CCALA 953 TaxID=987040 RepID=A0A2A2TB07_9CYAN|nr:alpha/beta hydrolase [Calothrix elsteri]PAX49097.1 alpha/beta hydrolase [Calothrix elsteri CCALA 953]
MPSYFQSLLLAATTIYHAIACWLEDKNPPPGQLIDIGDYKLHLYDKHLYDKDEGSPTVILEHSLGGIEGYFLIDELAKIGRVCIYDRAGFGWSDISPHSRTSENMVVELDTLLQNAGIEPPYILVGDSFGSYNARLYARRFPQKVVGMVLTDGLHESGMLKMPLGLQVLKYFFASGFVMSVFGAILGIIRIFKMLGIFELLKPELRKFPQHIRQYAIRSFCRPKHWLTMAQEILNLDASSKQVSVANNFGELPIVNIQASSFFKPAFWTNFIPLKSANKLRETMHEELMQLSSNCTQIQAHNSGHFVWIDQPEIISIAVRMVLEKIETM